MINEIAERYLTLNFVTNVLIKDKTVVVQVTVNEEDDFSLTVSFNDDFPQKLPTIYLDNPAKYGFLPHVCWKGIVCYTDNQGVSIDIDRPIDVAEYALNQAVEVLSIEKSKREELFYNEFEGYWNNQDSSRCVHLFSDLGDDKEILNVHINKKKLPEAFFSNNNKINLNDGYAFSNLCKSKKTQIKAFYFSLNSHFPPPLPKQEINIDYLINIFNALSDDDKAFWEECLSKDDIPKTLYIIFSQPRPIGGKSFFGLYAPYGLNWLNNPKGYKHQITPLSIQRHSPDYLLQRAGASTEYIDKKVAIIGCGSVGSRIAEFLVTSGVRNLTLIDDDLYTVDNIFRHILDSKYIRYNKAAALSSQLKSRFPYISINSIDEKIVKLSPLLIDMDVVVDATGEPTLSRQLNVQRHSVSNNAPILVTTWLEPMGLGGHAILSDGKYNGCLSCLYHKDNSETLISRTNFISENQVVTRNLTGCGGSFVPFGAIDAIKTSEIATRMILDVMSSEHNDYERYQWWCGSDDIAKENNIKTTEWYAECMNTDVSEQVDSLISEGCPVCRIKN
jgi:molybdopterin/thiamine biosynthesis adenylyltransferase